MESPLFTIVLAGIPHSKGRPRFRIVKPRGGAQFVSAYTDAATRAYETRLAAAGKDAMSTEKPLDEALWVDVTAFMAIPASWSRKARAAAVNFETMPVTRPDADNYAKAALDSLNGIVWTDDSRIVRLIVQKFYSEQPRLVVKVWKWADM